MPVLSAAPVRVNAAEHPTPFASGYLALVEAGGVPVVCVPGEKRPAFTGWKDKTRWAPETLAEIARKHPHANLGVNCGASNVTVIDIDDPHPETLRYVLDEFGETPLVIRTPRGGWHCYYRRRDERCGRFASHPDPLWAKLGADIRSKGGQVVAPPSVVERGTYQFSRAGGGWGQFGDLPELPAEHPALTPFREKDEENIRALRGGAGLAVGAGDRSNALLRWLLQKLAPLNGADASQVQARAQALAAQALAERIIDPSDGHPFTAEDVAKVVASATRYTTEGKNFHARRGGSAGLIRDDMAAVGDDSDAYVLRELLRAQHGGGKVFAVACAAMAHNVFPSWGRKRFEGALKRLLASGRLELVSRGRGRAPHLYRLSG